jgi:hypothetical protein
MRMRYLVALILIATTPFGSLGEDPASSSSSSSSSAGAAAVEHDVIQEDVNCTCSSAAVVPPLLPRTCHHVKSDNDLEEIREEHDLLQSSAEEIKAQIRRETAVNQQAAAAASSSDEGLLLPHLLLLSAEDVKAQIRREARLQTTRGVPGVAIDDHRLNAAASASSTAEVSSTTITTRSSTDSSVVDDDQPAVPGSDATSVRTRRTSAPSRPVEPLVDNRRSEIGEEPSTAAENKKDDEFSEEPTKRTTIESAHDKVLLPVELADKNYARDRGTLPVPNQEEEAEENGFCPPAPPTEGSEQPMLSSSSSSSSSFSTSTTNTLKEQYSNSTNTERDDRTMLDIFGERAKEFLTRRVVRFLKHTSSEHGQQNRLSLALSHSHIHAHTHTPPPLFHFRFQIRIPPVGGIGGPCGANRPVGATSNRAGVIITWAGRVGCYHTEQQQPTMMMKTASRCGRGTTMRPHDASYR